MSVAKPFLGMSVLQPTVKPLPIGANNIYTAGQVHQNQAIEKQTSLLQSTGGRRHSRHSRRFTKHRPKPKRKYKTKLFLSRNKNQTKYQKRKSFSRRRRIKRGGGTIAVPTFPNLYPEVGTGNQTVNGNSMLGAQLSVNAANNSKLDSCVGQPASCTTQVLSNNS